MIYAIKSSNIDNNIILGKILQYHYSYENVKTRWCFQEFSDKVEYDGSYIGHYKTDYSISNLLEPFKSVYDMITQGITDPILNDNGTDKSYVDFYMTCKKFFGNDIAIKRLIADKDENVILVDVSEPIDFIRLYKIGAVCINLVSHNEKIADPHFQFSDWSYQMFRTGVDDDIESFISDTDKMLNFLK